MRSSPKASSTSGTPDPKPPKPLNEYTLEQLKQAHAMLSGLYPPATVNDHRDISVKSSELLWAGGSHAVVKDLETAIANKIQENRP